LLFETQTHGAVIKWRSGQCVCRSRSSEPTGRRVYQRAPSTEWNPTEDRRIGLTRSEALCNQSYLVCISRLC